MNSSSTPATLENFDDVWGLLGDPSAVEAKLTELIAAANANADKSIYPLMLCQIALAQAMQQKYNEAHATLDKAEIDSITADSRIVKIQILLNRGKVFQQSGNTSNACNYFKQAYDLATGSEFDYYAIDAAHMIAIISAENRERIQWNETAITLANQTNNNKARAWLGSLYNNLGQSLLDAGRDQEALDAFIQALEYREKEGFIINIRVAKWAVACALRRLGRTDEALEIQLALFDDYETLCKNGNFGMPIEIYHSLRGFVCEELAELNDAKSDKEKSIYFARLAIEDLSKSKDPIFVKSVENRLCRLKQIINRFCFSETYRSHK